MQSPPHVIRTITRLRNVESTTFRKGETTSDYLLPHESHINADVGGFPTWDIVSMHVHMVCIDGYLSPWQMVFLWNLPVVTLSFLHARTCVVTYMYVFAPFLIGISRFYGFQLYEYLFRNCFEIGKKLEWIRK